MMWRYVAGIVLLAGILSLVVTTGTGGQVSAPDDANIILIATDMLRADHLPCYGYHRDTAPTICGLAEEGFIFENAYSAASWTLPSHASVFTSLYPGAHGAYDFNATLDEEYTAMAEILAQDGFKTAAFVGSKGGDAEQPLHLNSRHNLDQGFATYVEHGRYFRDTIPAATQWLKDNAEERFFMFLQSYDVHPPFDTPTHDDRFDPGYTGVLHSRNTTGLGNLRVRGEGEQAAGEDTLLLDQRDVRHLRAEYDGAIRAADRQVERFLSALKEEGVYNDSIIVFYSAHGVSLADRDGYFGHFEMSEEIVRVPLIIHVPGSDGHRIEDLAQLTDLRPTLHDLIRGEENDVAVSQGESLTPLMNGEEKIREYAYMEGLPFDRAAIRTEGWKLTLKGGRDFLQAVNHSTGRENTAREHPEIVEELSEEIRQRRQEGISIRARTSE